MSETLTASRAGNSAPNEDSVRSESLTAENINLSPLLTLSQEEHVMRDLHFQTTHSQVSKNFAFYNSNVFFSYTYLLLLNQLLFKFSHIVICLMLRLSCQLNYVPLTCIFLQPRNKLSVPLTVVTAFLFSMYNKNPESTVLQILVDQSG